MAVTAQPYATFFVGLLYGEHSFNIDTVAVALMTSSYTPDYTADDSYGTVAANEVTGAGYTAGGVNLTSLTVNPGPTSGSIKLDADPVSWTSISVTTRYALVYKLTGDQFTSKVIGAIDFGADRTYSAEPFQISFPDGLLLFEKSP